MKKTKEYCEAGNKAAIESKSKIQIFEAGYDFAMSQPKHIFAAERGELQLETRDGRKVVKFAWFREPCNQTDNTVLFAVLEDGEGCFYPISGKRRGFDTSIIDLFVSEPVEIKSDTSAEQRPLYEIGEIIEHDTPSGWIDVESIKNRNDQVCIWSNGMYKSILHTNVRKKQIKKTVTLDDKVMTVIEAVEYLNKL